MEVELLAGRHDETYKDRGLREEGVLNGYRRKNRWKREKRKEKKNEEGIEYISRVKNGEEVHDKKIKAVKGMVVITGVWRGQKGFNICYLSYLMKLCPSDGLWVKKKTLILKGTWKSDRIKALVGFMTTFILELTVHGKNRMLSRLAGKKHEEDASDEIIT
ncbi:hypothetical protein ACLOJK_013572 [Asimina triloba]